MKIAALYVEADGPYSSLPGVEVWDAARDARNFKGPHAVVAHPPCERWGRYWSGGPSAKTKRLKGDDGGCFAHALWAVRSFSGVLEHPEASHAWEYFGLVRPPKNGGWIAADRLGGWTCCVEQGHYGHPARKATWLYVMPRNGQQQAPGELLWGPSKGKQRLDEGFHSAEERRTARANGAKPRPRLNKREKLWTPPAFRDILLNLVLGG